MACVRVAVVLMRCCSLIVSRSATVRFETEKFKFQANCNITELRPLGTMWTAGVRVRKIVIL